ncbi:MAG: dephospho-CoA kinase [Actinomycetia bacterium]|nr:dephospho-CoA kinase [Actinomycetes bacterium]
MHPRSAHRPVVLTGGVGSGKSSVGRLLSAWGAHVVDADVLAREVVAPGGAGLAAVVAAFGTAVLSADGSLDRAGLAELVFNAPDQLAQLEAIIHPQVQSEAAERFALDRDAALLVYEVPIPGHSPFADPPVVVVVDAPDDARRERLRQRGLDETQIEARMAAQQSRVEWLALADRVVDNGGDEVALRVQVARLWRWLTGDDPPVSAGR